MVTTGYGVNMAPGQVFDRADEPVVSSDWTVIDTWYQARPAVDTWWVSVSVVASVDPGVEGALRIVATDGDLTSTEARIVAHVGPVLLGWLQLQWTGAVAEQVIRLEGRRTKGSGGGVRRHRSSLTLMTAPPAGQQGGPTYPAGQDPPAPPAYPTDYSTADPYGG